MGTSVGVLLTLTVVLKDILELVLAMLGSLVGIRVLVVDYRMLILKGSKGHVGGVQLGLSVI